MKIVVIGGTGLIGSKTVAILRQGGHEVVAASRKTGVNTVTGEGLKEAMSGAQVVIDLSNVPPSDRQAALEFFETSGRNLVAAEAAADRQGTRPRLLPRQSRPRETDRGFRYSLHDHPLDQFLEFLGGIADASMDGGLVRIPAGLLQPADDVAAAEVAFDKPRNGIVEIAGPERAEFNEIVAGYLKAAGDPRKVVKDPEARYFGGRLKEKSLVPLGEARLGRLNLEEWLGRSRMW